MRSLIRNGALGLIAALAASCSDSVTGTPSPAQDAAVAVGARFTPAASTIFNGLAPFGLKVATARLRLVAADSSARDTTLAFPSGIESVLVNFGVPGRTAGQVFRADVELYDANGFVLFSGSAKVTARDASTPGSPTIVDVSYTGPGADAASLVVTPSAPSATGTASLSMTATALGPTGTPLPLAFVRWTSSDVTLATLGATGSATANLSAAGKRGSVTVTAVTPTGVSGTARVSLYPAPARLVIVSGGGQTATAGSALPQPLVVEVQAADNLPVAGAMVLFRPMSSGCSVASATATTDGNGRASTSLTLGPAVGAHQFEAATPSVAPVTTVAMATPAPPALIQVVSGNVQAGRAGTVLPLPFVAKVTNRFGAPVAGVSVAWTVAPGGGTPSAATSTTAADGTTSITFTVGADVKAQSVTASVQGITGPGSSVVFTVVVIPGPPGEIYVTSGSGQHGAAGSQLPNVLVATVTDANGNPLQDYAVTWTTAPTAGRATFSPATSRTDAQGNATTTVTLGATVGAFQAVATINDISTTFNLSVDQGSGAPGTLSGLVYNAVTGAPMPGVSVDIAPTGSVAARQGPVAFARFAAPISRSTSLASMVTGSDGRYTSQVLAAACYDVTLSYTGFVLTTIVNQCVDGNSVAEAAPLVPFSASPGSITGSVLNATNNQAVSGSVTVQLRAGMHNVLGQVLQTVTTTNGQYQFTSVAPGTYTVQATANGFTAASRTGIAVGATNTGNQNVYLSPVGAAGSVRIVLTWRSTPRDLDSHLTGPLAAGGRFHVWYGGQGNCAGSPFACLDVDVTSGYGPETVTIPQLTPGMYRYSVQNYSAAGNGSNPTDLTLSNSGGRVDVYVDNALVHTFSVPAGAGSLWTVFEMNGTTITPVNTVTAGPVLFSSRIPTAEAPAATPGTDAGIIFNSIRTRPKGRVAAPR